jgi:sugar phosphate permease
MVIPVLRDLFLLENGTGWQKVFLIPAIGGMAMGIFSLEAMPETPVYLKRRIHALENPGEAPATKQKTTEQSQGGVVDALKFIFAHKQMRSLALCAFVFVASTGGTNYYESIMKTCGMTTGQITDAMFFIPPVNAAMTALSGFVTDFLGRKRSVMVHTAIALVGLICFVVSASFGLPPVLVGISYGLFIGGLWSAADILFILLPGESTPTNLRVSVVGTMGIMSGIGNVMSVAILVVGMLFVESIGLLYLCVAVPFMLAAMVILATRVRETRDMDLATVTGSEWD